ncbi:hypothetical protein SAMN04488072_1234 [Lentibacillus halodurans]|uniref:Uncharacterized protein n=1 Tax=Lentibacillus halodurans TaxID=237679 RepID=A0A1I1AK97_9BACI|nr:hypothetical protein SAMN04488072_1234 [Lentibacillus halodurans]
MLTVVKISNQKGETYANVGREMGIDSSIQVRLINTLIKRNS